MKNQKKQGFSLIEIMVSLAIFAVVVVVATGALLSTIDATKKAQATQTVLTNLNLTLEGMTREIRTGSGYVILDSGASIKFDNKNKNSVTYSLVSEVVGSSNGNIKRTTVIGAQSPVVEILTAPEVNVKDLKFTEVNTLSQPRIFITLRGIAGANPKYRTTFEIQTSVSQRMINR